MTKKTLLSLIRDFPANLDAGSRAGGMVANFVSSDYSSINYIHVSLTRAGARFLLELRQACDMMWAVGRDGEKTRRGLPLCINFRSGDFGLKTFAYLDISVEDEGQFDELALRYGEAEDFGKEVVTLSSETLIFYPQSIILEISEKFSGESAKISLETHILEQIVNCSEK
jgi:hypothetical protein